MKEKFYKILKHCEKIIKVTSIELSERAKLRKLNYSWEIILDLDNCGFVEFEVAVTDIFPFTLPVFFVKGKVELFSNVEPDGYLCYVDPEAVIYDYDDPLLIDKIINAVKNTLSQTEEEQISSLHREFAVYWSRNSKHIGFIDSIINVTDSFKEVYALTYSHNAQNSCIIFSDKEAINYKFIGINKGVKSEVENRRIAYYIPLKSFFNKPPKFEKFYSIDQLFDMIKKNVININLSKIKSDSQFVYVLLYINHPINDILGLKINRNSTSKTPIFEAKFCESILPFSINRKDQNFLCLRGGSNSKFKSKKILLIGCGSVGSYLLEYLINSGFDDFSLVDNDLIKEENIYRHILGLKDVSNGSINKADALKSYYEKKNPYVTLNSYPENITKLIKGNELNLNEYDIIVSATGNPTVNLFINDFIKYNSILTPVAYCWNEAFGLGGHTIITNNNGKSGCLRCLYNDQLHNHASFYSSDNTKAFVRKLSGCGSSYTPYSSLDSLRTVLMTVEIIIEVILGKETDNPIISWKGSPYKALQECYKLSKRYYDFNKKQIDPIYKYSYKKSDCRWCNNV